MDDARHEDDSVETPPSVLPTVPELSQLMVHLLKGVLYRDDDERLWASLLRLQARVREQAAVLLLDVVLDEAEGHAFLKSRPDPDEAEGAPRLPRLVARRPLSYPVSLMLALLRKRMAEFDAGGGDTHGFAILDQLRGYFPHVASFLMDRETLLAHRLHWGEEPEPARHDLSRLTAQETAVYDDLRFDRLQPELRLEQERVGFRWLNERLAALVAVCAENLPSAAPMKARFETGSSQ